MTVDEHTATPLTAHTTPTTAPAFRVPDLCHHHPPPRVMLNLFQHPSRDSPEPSFRNRHAELVSASLPRHSSPSCRIRHAELVSASLPRHSSPSCRIRHAELVSASQQHPNRIPPMKEILDQVQDDGRDPTATPLTTYTHTASVPPPPAPARHAELVSASLPRHSGNPTLYPSC